jgi:hypothetical protein
MLYLFNSAYRVLYLRNVMNTLFIPVGGTNQYRYRFRGSSGDSDYININKLSYDELVTYARGSTVCIIFVDRFSPGGYTYHPLRLALFIKTSENNDYLHFHVQLDKFIYPRDSVTFNQDFRDHLHKFGVPKLTNNDPKSSNDGYYAVIADSLFSHTDDFFSSKDSWTHSVRALESCSAFTADSKKEFVFVRCTLHDADKGSIVEPYLLNNTAIYHLTKATKYKLDLPYRYPAQVTETSATATLECKLGDNLKALPDQEINIDSCNNNPPYYFTTKRYIEDNADAISFKFATNREGVEVIGTDAKLEVRISESRWFWLQIAIAVLLFSILSVVIGADLSSIQTKTLDGLFGALWPKWIASLFQAIVLFWLFKLVGKKLF